MFLCRSSVKRSSSAACLQRMHDANLSWRRNFWYVFVSLLACVAGVCDLALKVGASLVLPFIGNTIFRMKIEVLSKVRT